MNYIDSWCQKQPKVKNSDSINKNTDDWDPFKMLLLLEEERSSFHI